MLIRVNSVYGWLGKAPACHVAELDTLARELQTIWAKLEFKTDSVLNLPYVALVQRILKLLPQTEGLEIKLSDLQADLQAFERLFLRDGGQESLLLAHHRFTPKVERKQPEPGQPVTVDQLPFPTSGDLGDDQLASLLASMPDHQSAIWAWSNLSLDRIDRVLFVLRELNRPSEERIGDYLQQVAAQELSNNPEMTDQAMLENMRMLRQATANREVPEGWEKR